MPELVLLSHQTEPGRASNSGKLLPAALATVADSRWRLRQLIWQRTAPDPQLLADLQAQLYVLLYPSTNAMSVNLDSASPPPHDIAGFILLDATWQQARKMYNQSPYLQSLSHWHCEASYQSQFRLRRNQLAGGWCTAETVALLWQSCGATAEAQALWQLFHQFNQR